MDKATKDKIISKLCEANSEIECTTSIMNRNEGSNLIRAGILIDEVMEIIGRQ